MTTNTTEVEQAPFGDTRAIGRRLNRLAEQLDATSDLWAWALREGSAADPLRNVMLRALLLVGTETVLIADGTLGETEDPEGFVVLVTPTRLIRATFSGFTRNNGWPSLDGVVEAVPLKAVVRVGSLAVSQGRHEDSAWPNAAQLVLYLDRELAGVSEITIPERAATARQNPLEVAKLAARLPLT